MHDSADVQRASLTVIINCVCAPISRPNNLGRAATGITGSSVKKKPTGKALFFFYMINLGFFTYKNIIKVDKVLKCVKAL